MRCALHACEAPTCTHFVLAAARAGLHYLSLNHCTHLTGQSLRHLQSMPGLASLDLGSNAWLQDADMASLRKLPSLRTLCLAECKGLTSAGAAPACPHVLHIFRLTCTPS